MKDSPKGLGAIVKKIADLVCSTEHFAQDAGKKLYWYVDGQYRPDADKFLKIETKRLCDKFGSTPLWSPRLAVNVIEYIRVDAPELWERPPIDVVNVKNGLLDVRTGELRPHSHEHLSPIQLPLKFDPAARCPAIDQFIREVFPADAIDLAYEIPGLLMMPYTSVQKAILLLGDGGNGKSTYLSLVTKFVGKRNTSAVSIHQLESNRFSVAGLVGKLANICADLPTEHLASTNIFKAVTTADAVTAERKFHEGFDFEPYARLVFSANSPPRSKDNTSGFFDRWCVVPFDRRIRGSEMEVTRSELDARLSTPGELSGLLNQVLPAARRILKTGELSNPPSVRTAFLEFRAATDPFAVWLDRYTVDDPSAVVPKCQLREAYAAYCDRTGNTALSDRAFGLAMQANRPRIESKQRTVDGRLQHCYTGIGLSPISHFEKCEAIE